MKLILDFENYSVSLDGRVINNTAKKMVDVGEDFKIVCSYIKKSYEDIARENYGFFDNLQYQKAFKSAIDYM